MATNPFELDTATATTAVADPAPAQSPAPVPQQPQSVPEAGGEDPFDGPAPQSDRPKIKDAYGRLLLIVPHLKETVPNRLQPGQMQERLTADVIVLDCGINNELGPLQYGGDLTETPPVPHDKSVAIPHKVDRMFLSQKGLISQCEKALLKRLAGGQGMVLGRLSKGEKPKEAGHNAPWLLAEPTESDRQVARQYLKQVDPFS